jgi:O-antigen/teichoic acid export membrane protein
MGSLREKTINGFLWSFVDIFANQGVTFLVGIVLARVLSPFEFGLIGLITIFIAISESFVNSGFSSALIRKKYCSNIDYSTVFFFNFFVGVFFFVILFVSAPAISTFLSEPELKDILRIFGIILIIDALSIIQKTILVKEINFKLQTRISIIASLVSGFAALTLAFNGFGVWSLVAQRLIKGGLITILLWYFNSWRPILVFSTKSFNELFGFGSKLLVSGLIDTIFTNIYYIVIGKYFSTQSVGYFTKAQEFCNVPSQGLSAIVSRVSFPVLSDIQDNHEELKNGFKRIIRITMFVSFVCMALLAAVAEPLILVVIGQQWSSSVILLQLLCIVAMMYPLHALNLNLLKVLGRSGLYLKIEVIKKVLAIPTIILGIFFGVKVMIIGMAINSFISFFINSYWSGKRIGYTVKDQLLDIFPSFVFSVFFGSMVFLVGFVLPIKLFWTLSIQLFSSVAIFFILAELVKQSDYLALKEMVIEKLAKTNRP